MSRKFVKYYFCYESAGHTCNPFIIPTSRENVWDLIRCGKDDPSAFNCIANNYYNNARVFKHIRVHRDGCICTYMVIYADNETHNELIRQFNKITNYLEEIQ